MVRLIPTRRQLLWTSFSSAGTFHSFISTTAVVLHYAYSHPEDVAAKANRSCPEDYLAAVVAGDAEKLKSCFIIDLDKDAFLAAAAKNESKVKDLFYGRLVWSEGRPVKCPRPEKTSGSAVQPPGRSTAAANEDLTATQGWCNIVNMSHAEALLSRAGLVRRFHAVQQALRGHELAIAAMGPRVRTGG